MAVFMHKDAEMKMQQSCLHPAQRAGKINLLCLIVHHFCKEDAAFACGKKETRTCLHWDIMIKYGRKRSVKESAGYGCLEKM